MKQLLMPRRLITISCMNKTHYNPSRRPNRPPRPERPQRPDRTPPSLMPTTLWDFPAQNYGGSRQGDTAYVGATPSYVVWNMVERYSQPGDLVVDPMAGSGTTLDVARDLGRKALAYDLVPRRQDIFRADCRKLPLEDGKAALVFVDPPYSTHIEYSADSRCIGKLDAEGSEYYEAMALALAEINRILKPGGYLGLYVSDSFVKGKGFFPIGFELFSLMREHFLAVDIISVVRHNKTLAMGNYRKAALDGNFYLRGFNYLFIMQKPVAARPAQRAGKGSRPKNAGRSAKTRQGGNAHPRKRS